MTPELNIFLGIAAMILIGNSWYIHYKVKDGLARLMLLWGCGMLFALMFVRVAAYLLIRNDLISNRAANTIFQYNIFFIYAIVLGQQWIQRGRSERNEDDKLQKDNKELKKRRKDDNK